MTIHAISGFVSVNGMAEAEIQTAVDDWVSARAKWSSDWDAAVTRQNTQMDGSGTDYFRFNIRFEWSEAKDNTLQKAADKVKNKVDWFVLVYHVCDHDEGNPTGCSWDERWEWTAKDVTIPTNVEAQVPDAPTVVNA